MHTVVACLVEMQDYYIQCLIFLLSDFHLAILYMLQFYLPCLFEEISLIHLALCKLVTLAYQTVMFASFTDFWDCNNLLSVLADVGWSTH